MSERRACRLVEFDRSYHYEPRADHNAELLEELMKPAWQKPRYRYQAFACAIEQAQHSCSWAALWFSGTSSESIGRV